MTECEYAWLPLLRTYACACMNLHEIFCGGQLKFHKDPRFYWGDIQLFVTLYDLDFELLLQL